MDRLLLLAPAVLIVWSLFRGKRNNGAIKTVAQPTVKVPAETMSQQLTHFAPIRARWVRVGGRPMVRLPTGEVIEPTEAYTRLSRTELQKLGNPPLSMMPTVG